MSPIMILALYTLILMRIVVVIMENGLESRVGTGETGGPKKSYDEN